MHSSFRALRLWAGVGLLGLSHLGRAQTTPPTREDSLKGRLWTATARHIWADTKPPQAQPAPWPTVEAFEAWRIATPDDKSELGLLWGDVVKSFGAGAKGTPAQVAQAILTQITQRQQSKTGRLTRLNLAELKADFAQLAAFQAKEVAARQPRGGSTVMTAIPGASGLTALPADTVRPPAPQEQPAAPAFVATPAEPKYFGLSPTLAGVTLLLLGALAGTTIAQNLRRRPRHRPHAHATSPLATSDSSSIMSSPEYRKLLKQNQNLTTQLHRIQQQLAELKAQLAGTPPTLSSVVEVPRVAEEPPVAEPLSVEELVGAPLVAALPSATRYGPVQETPFVEERKLVDLPLPQLALMLTVNPRTPDQAAFTLNPSVDQARLIGDGLTRLQKFFDYDPPLGGRITLVTAAAAGQLQRHADGWQVVQRARLTIS